MATLKDRVGQVWEMVGGNVFLVLEVGALVDDVFVHPATLLMKGDGAVDWGSEPGERTVMYEFEADPLETLSTYRRLG